MLFQETKKYYHSHDPKGCCAILQYECRGFLNHAAELKMSIPCEIAMYICRELTDASLPKIGQEFGGRDHTTVIHACEKVKEYMKMMLL